jgi:hypothetical protein
MVIFLVKLHYRGIDERTTVLFPRLYLDMYDRANVNVATLNQFEDRMPLRHQPCEPSVTRTQSRRRFWKPFAIVFDNTSLKARL